MFTDGTNKDVSIPIKTVIEAEYAHWLEHLATPQKQWLQALDFKAQAGKYCFIPNEQAGLDAVVLVLKNDQDFLSVSCLPSVLPPGCYELETQYDYLLDRMLLAWGMAFYQFERYCVSSSPCLSELIIPQGMDVAPILSKLSSINLVRDLINTPTEDMAPQHVANIARDIAEQFSAQFREIGAEALIAEGFPLVHAVGRAATDVARQPRVIELSWGEQGKPLVSLVGKGVCYDTGGLSLKSTKSMFRMKKDMGGGAHVLALARLIMAMQLPVRLQVLIPLVENAVSGNSYRPGDVFMARNGVSVEITNTDAEGRLVLADALVAACEQQPDLLIDMATLTGAARVALGPEVSAFMTSDAALSDSLVRCGRQCQDLMWPLPLHAPYMTYLKSDIADMTNCATNGFAGAIVAGLFLQKFVTVPTWLHCDIYAWYDKASATPLKAAAATGLLALWSMLCERYPLAD